jgi:hypothetical protein
MRGSIRDVPVTVDIPEGKIRQAEWGGTVVELGSFRQTVDPAPLFKGLPDDRCQCPHWGYVLKGRMRFRYADHEEVYNAGDAYYAPPGHLPLIEAGAEYVEFSHADQLAQSMQVIERNMQSATAG